MHAFFAKPEVTSLLAHLEQALQRGLRLDEFDARDIALRALEKVHRQFEKWERGEREDPLTLPYCLTVARRLWLEGEPAQSRLQQFGDLDEIGPRPSAEPPGAEAAEMAEYRQRVTAEVNRAVAALTDTVRPAAIFRHYYRMPWQDIAEVLAIDSRNVIEQRIKHATRALRETVRVRGEARSPAPPARIRAFLLDGVQADLTGSVSELRRRRGSTEWSGTLALPANPRVAKAWGLAHLLAEPFRKTVPFPLDWDKTTDTWVARFSTTLDTTCDEAEIVESETALGRLYVFQDDYLRLW